MRKLPSSIALRFFSDPAHGWLRVPIKYLNPELDISGWSFITKRYAYLEEDRDCRLFLNYCKEHNITYTILKHSVNSESHIRRYQRFTKDLLREHVA